MKTFSLLSYLTFIIALCLFSTGFKLDSKPETQICYGPTITTEELHNVHCGNVVDAQHECWSNDNWYLHRYTLTVSAPTGWHFTGNPYVHCVTDNQGSCAWNGGAIAYSLTVTQSNPNYKEVHVSIGSRSIEVNLACEAVKD